HLCHVVGLAAAHRNHDYIFHSLQASLAGAVFYRYAAQSLYSDEPLPGACHRQCRITPSACPPRHKENVAHTAHSITSSEPTHRRAARLAHLSASTTRT